MSDRSELQTDALRVGGAVGFGAWALGTALLVVLVWWVVGPGGPRPAEVTVYHEWVLWFVTVQNQVVTSPLVLPLGIAVWVLLAAGGAVAHWLFDGEIGPRTVVTLGAGFGIGHAVGFTVVFYRWGPVFGLDSDPWPTVLLVLGGFVLPAALATVGAVLAVVVEDPLGVGRI
jgi:hypothetical protein